MRRETSEQTRIFAKSLRTNATEAERKLWAILRAKRLSGHKFRRQVPLEGYVADFVCFESKLIVEADGSQHAESAHDARRDTVLAEAGFLTIRFWNNEIVENPNGVYIAIEQALKRKL